MPLLFTMGLFGVGTAATFKLLASGAEDAGQAIDAAGSGALKIALAAGITYGALKYGKVI